LNDAPVASGTGNEATYDTNSGSHALAVPAGTDVDDPASSLVVGTITQPAVTHGTVVLEPDGTVVYTQTDTNYVGDDTFTYTLKDPAGAESAPATYTVHLVKASNFTGQTIGYVYQFPDLGSVRRAADVVVGPGVEIPSIVPVAPVGSLNLEGDRAVVSFTADSQWTPSPFNGFQLTDRNDTVRDIVGVTILDNGGVPGLDASRITFDANNIYVNWQGLPFVAGQQVELGITFA
jgi:hypothetical protein